MAIKHVKYNQIDFEKWDDCISKSLNSFSFAYSWYLDIITESWDALIENDYERVMPLTFDFKLNYQFVYHPYLAPQLGIFTTTPLNSDDIKRFIENIPQKFKNIELNLNKFNLVDTHNYQIIKNSLFSIDLILSYEKIYNKYSFDLKNLFSELDKKKFYISKGILPNEVIEFLRLQKKIISEDNLNILRKVISFTLNKRYSVIYCAYNETNELEGIAFFIISNYNANMLLLTVNEENNKTEIEALLVDAFIKDHSERSITLNIEANNFPNFKETIRNFGAKEYFYQTVIINRLPRIFRIFQKKKF